MWRERQKWRGIPEMGRGVSHTDGSGLSRNLREIAHRLRSTRRVKGVGAGGKCRALPRGVINSISISKLHTAYETSQTLNLKLLGLLIDDVYHCICYRLRLDEACHAHSWFVFVFFSSRPKVSRQLQLPATTHTRERSTGDAGHLP